jgi:hypothetical protein
MGRKLKKHIALAVGHIVPEYSNKLIDEFFKYVQGNYQNLTIDVSDICDLEQPTPEYLGKALSRYTRIWKQFCQMNKLPGESQNLLMAKVKRKWIDENWEKKLAISHKKRKNDQS